jgi:hypothetical protein
MCVCLIILLLLIDVVPNEVMDCNSSANTELYIQFVQEPLVHHSTHHRPSEILGIEPALDFFANQRSIQ